MWHKASLFAKVLHNGLHSLPNVVKTGIWHWYMAVDYAMPCVKRLMRDTMRFFFMQKLLCVPCATKTRRAITPVVATLLLAGCGGGGEIDPVTQGTITQQSAVIDLTVPFGDDDFPLLAETPLGVDQQAQAEEEADTGLFGLPRINFNRQGPDDVAVASIGIGRDLSDVYGGAFNRDMWENSAVDEIIALLDRLPIATQSEVINNLTRAMVVGRAIPPPGANNKADVYFRQRMDWLRDRGLSFDMAEMVRQLPDDPKWENLQRFLTDHNLITRRDVEACRLAREWSEQSNDLYWFQVLGFCALRNGEVSQARFQLDVLEARGLTDALFFELMRSWLDGVPAQRVNDRDIKPTGINVALMDSASYAMRPNVRLSIPLALSQSLGGIGFTIPQTSYIQQGIAYRYGQDSLLAQLAAWRQIADDSPDANSAVPQLANMLEAGADPVTTATGRVVAWRSLWDMPNADDRLELALAALQGDIVHLGGDALTIWAPHLAASVASARNAGNRAQGIRFLAIAGIAPPGVAGGQVSQAWAGLQQAVMVDERVPLSMIRLIDGYDAIPLLQRAGVSVESLGGQDVFATRPVLAKTIENLPYPDALWLTQLVRADRPAEAVLMASALLDTTPLYRLTREDATRIVGALYDMGLADESRLFALEVIRAWGGWRASQNQDN